jgi:threonine/homoserine/homoserine lactone efflux protein
MGQVVGDLLPLAVGVAVSPVPIIAVILMLLAPRAGTASLGFAAGWVLGIVAVTAIAAGVAGTAGADDGDGDPSSGASWIRLVLGLVLLVLAALQWRRRPKPGEQPALPTWMAAIDGMTPVKAFGLGAALAAVNPKNLVMCLSAGVTIADGALDAGEQALVIALFTALAACTVLVPVVAYLVAKTRMRAPLDELRGWLQVNNATVMSVLLMVIGVTLVGKGLGALL